ncbi:MAG: hypothetical protein FWF15_11370 [Oscillospiraceae bacterium]|nr:hypothetical protein [Oscillospiraceae bacterium]
MVRIESFAVDLYGGYTDTKILKQYDDTVLSIKVFYNGQPVEAETVILIARFENGGTVTQTGNIKISGNRVTVKLSKHITGVSGNVQLELRFLNAFGDQISTYIFNAYIEPSLLPGVLPPTVIYIVSSEQIKNIWVGFQKDYDEIIPDDDTIYCIEG